MSTRLRFRLTGIALIVGGLVGGICHMFNFDSPHDVTQLVDYARFGEPLHLFLFAGGILVLLGSFGRYALECSASGAAGFASFFCLFVGILCGDLLHCVLEFSVFPVLTAVVPYALPGLADATYRSAPLVVLLTLSQYLMFAGVAAAAFSGYRSRIVPGWTAIPFALTAALLAVQLVPRLRGVVGPISSIALYLSLAVLGFGVISSTPQRGANRAAQGVNG